VVDATGETIVEPTFAATVGLRRVFTASVKKLEFGPLPNVMATQPNIGGALSGGLRYFGP